MPTSSESQSGFDHSVDGVDNVPAGTSDGGDTVGPTPGGTSDGGGEADDDARQRHPRTNKSFIISLTPTLLLFLKIYKDYVAEARRTIPLSCEPARPSSFFSSLSASSPTSDRHRTV